ncbi:MAG: DUF1330 domain-containing protein [Gammaproteobacteria bacterium]|nr:DUF1330 domain-containing protein [Chloroflexota bacterium]MYE13700.1 DUF1330 domain-containing protein [Gammaproteobacteria bacterium]
MPAYLIANVDVQDADSYAGYGAQVPGTLEAYGGRFVVRGGASEVLEGEFQPKRVVVLEFPDMETLKAWYDSDAYQGIVGIRWEAATASVIAVEGV